jgi:hypothetical protein
MTTLTHKRTKLTFQQVLQAAQELPPQDQRRLRDELAEWAGVYLVRPTATAAAVQEGRRLAKAIRAELADSATASLDEVMARLRGQSCFLRRAQDG